MASRLIADRHSALRLASAGKWLLFIAPALLIQVVDPDTAIGMIRDFTNNVSITHFYSWTLPPGLPPRWAQTHLELFASKVIPAFR